MCPRNRCEPPFAHHLLAGQPPGSLLFTVPTQGPRAESASATAAALLPGRSAPPLQGTCLPRLTPIPPVGLRWGFLQEALPDCLVLCCQDTAVPWLRPLSPQRAGPVCCPAPGPLFQKHTAVFLPQTLCRLSLACDSHPCGHSMNVSPPWRPRLPPLSQGLPSLHLVP